MRRLQTRYARSHVSKERWLVSYADFITLLFAFFATMYAISSVDAQKLTTVAHALQVAFDDSAKGRSLASGHGLLPENGVLVPNLNEQSTADVESKVSRELAEELASHKLELIVDRRGVTISIPEAGTFGIGRDELSDTAQGLVSRVANTLGGFANSVRVEGHTDDVGSAKKNLELSQARAEAVREQLIAKGIEPDQLQAIGYGNSRPLDKRRTAEARARNRRVEFIIVEQ